MSINCINHVTFLTNEVGSTGRSTRDRHVAVPDDQLADHDEPQVVGARAPRGRLGGVFLFVCCALRKYMLDRKSVV